MSDGKLIQVWLMQWGRSRDLAGWDRSGAAYMTNDRLARMVNEAYTAGYADGELQGRANYRLDIENGTIPSVEQSGVPASE